MLGEILETEDLVRTLQGGGWLAVGVGVGVALLMSRSFRPLAKQAIKGYLSAAEGMQRAAYGARAGLQDVYSEAKAEREAMAQSETAEAGE